MTEEEKRLEFLKRMSHESKTLDRHKRKKELLKLVNPFFKDEIYERAGMPKDKSNRKRSRSCSTDSFKSGEIYSENEGDEEAHRRDYFMKRVEKRVVRTQGIHGYEAQT